MISAWVDTKGQIGTNGPADAIFPYWSFTKTVIATCALRLAEADILDLDAALPNQPYTLRQLLSHHAGLRDYGGVQAYQAAVKARELPWSVDRLVAESDADTLAHPPGQAFSYSNIGYLLVRQILEEVCGLPLGEIIHTHVTGPLELSSVKVARTVQDMGSIHWNNADGYHPDWVYHGCLIGTAPDAARLLHALAGGNLLSAASLETMAEPHFQADGIAGRPWIKIGYGLGLMQGMAGDLGPLMGHSGCGPFCANAVYHFPNCGAVTVASFTTGGNEAPAEWEAVRIAGELAPSR